jgi:hypothetical protein
MNDTHDMSATIDAAIAAARELDIPLADIENAIMQALLAFTGTMH